MRTLIAFLILACAAYAQTWTLVQPTTRPVTALYAWHDTLWVGTWGEGVFPLGDTARYIPLANVECIGDAWGEVGVGADCNGFYAGGTNGFRHITNADYCTEAITMHGAKLYVAPNGRWVLVNADTFKTWDAWGGMNTVWAFAHDSTGHLYAATEIGLYSLLPTRVIVPSIVRYWRIAYNACDSSLYATGNGGLWRDSVRVASLGAAYALALAPSGVYVGAASHGDWGGDGVWRWDGKALTRYGLEGKGVGALVVYHCRLYAGAVDGIYSTPLCVIDTVHDSSVVHDTLNTRDTVNIRDTITLVMRDTLVVHDSTVFTIYERDTIRERDTLYVDTATVRMSQYAIGCDTTEIAEVGIVRVVIYPSPAHRRIGYAITGERVLVVLQLFDNLGRYVAGESRVSPYRGEIGDGLAAGVYYLRVQGRIYVVVVQ